MAKKAPARKGLLDAVNRLAATQSEQNAQLMQELADVRAHMEQMKATLERLKPVRPKRSLLRRKRSIPVYVEPETAGKDNAILLEELLPLLTQLGGFIPQLKNPKMAETLKVLSNPAVVRMIQQFLSSGGLRRETAAQAHLKRRG